MRYCLLRGMLLAVLSGSPVLAGDMVVAPRYGGPRPVPVPVNVFSWTGWYAGAFIGGAFGQNASTSYPCNTAGCYLTPLSGEIICTPCRAVSSAAPLRAITSKFPDRVSCSASRRRSAIFA